MASFRHLALALLVSSILNIGASVDTAFLEKLADERESGMDWDNEQLMMDFQVLCNNGTLMKPGEFAPGVNMSTIVQTFRSAWRADSLAEVAASVCRHYGPLLNLMSGGVVRTICEPIIQAMDQGEETNIEGTCYQLWQTIQHGSAISSVPSCPAWLPDQTNYDQWYDDYNYPNYPADYDPTLNDGKQPHDNTTNYTERPQDDSRDYHERPHDDSKDYYDLPQEHSTEGYFHDNYPAIHDGGYHHLDIWQFKHIVEAAFAVLGRGSESFCFNVSAVIFNESISSFTVIDHALSGFLWSKLGNFESFCEYQFLFTTDATAYGMDITTSLLFNVSQSLGIGNPCEVTFDDSVDKSGIIDMAKMKIFDALKDVHACLDLYNMLADFAESINKATGMPDGESLCEKLVTTFTMEAGVEVNIINFNNSLQHYYYNYVEWPLYEGDVLPGVPFEDAIAMAANVLNSMTAAEGLSVICRAYNSILDYNQLAACSALNEHNYDTFLDMCHSSNLWPEWLFPREEEESPYYPYFHGLDFLNNFFLQFYKLKEKASQFDHDIMPNVDLSEFIYPYDYTSEGDICPAIGNLLFNDEIGFVDIILPIVEKQLHFLYLIAPHYCHKPLTPDYQWPGTDDEHNEDLFNSGEVNPDRGRQTPEYMEEMTTETTLDYEPFRNRKTKREAEMTTDTPFRWEDTTVDQDWDYDKSDSEYPGKSYDYDFDPWWDLHIGIIHGDFLKKVLTFISNFQNHDEFCLRTMEQFERNETMYRLDSMEAVQRMKEKLLSILHDYNSCILFTEYFKENLTDYEFYQMTKFATPSSVCEAVISSFSGQFFLSGLNSSFYWPSNDYDYAQQYGFPTHQNQPGEVANGVSLSSFIEFAGGLYNANIRDGTLMICRGFKGILGYSEKETCQFLFNEPTQDEFVSYCQNYGTYDDYGSGNENNDNHHGGYNGGYDEEHHESHSIFNQIPWDELPSILADLWGTTLESIPMCSLGWDLYSSQSVKSTLENAFRTLTRLHLHASADVQCDSDVHVKFSNETHFAVDYLYDYVYGDTEVSDMVSENFLGELYTFLGGYNNTNDLCIDIQSLREFPEEILQIEEIMTNRLFELVQNTTSCKSFLAYTFPSDELTDISIWQLAGFESDDVFCETVVNYMTDLPAPLINATILIELLENVEEMDVTNSVYMDTIIGVAAFIYRAENIKQLIETFCPIVELAPHLVPDVEITEGCRLLQKINDTTFDEICTDTLQCYIPYFWLAVNNRDHNPMKDVFDNNDYDHQTYYDWNGGNYQNHYQYQYDYYNGNANILNHMSFETMGQIFSHVIGVSLLDSTVTCTGLDSWLQASQGPEIFDSMFRLFQLLIISDAENICPTHYYSDSERPHRQPDLHFDGTEFRDIIGAVNQFLGNYSDYENLCWDAQTAYQDWRYHGDSSRVDAILDKMAQRFMEVIQMKDQCLEFTASMNRMPIYGPVAAWIGFETNEELCDVITYYFSEKRDIPINLDSFMSILQSEENGDFMSECWTVQMKNAVEEVIKIASQFYHYDAINSLTEVCNLASALDFNGTFPAEISIICEHMRSEGSVLLPCLDIVSTFMDNNIPYFDEETWRNHTSSWSYIEGVVSKVGQIFWSMYSDFGLRYERLERVAQHIQTVFHFGFFNLDEPYSSCSFLRLLLTTNHTMLIQQAKMVLSYPIADLLEYSGNFGICSIRDTNAGQFSTDVIAYRFLRNLLVTLSGMEETDFCGFLSEEHSSEEYIAQGMLMAENVFNILTDQVVCNSVISVVAAEDRFYMLYNLTGMNLTLPSNRVAFCQHVVSSFSGDASFTPLQYALSSTQSLDLWIPFAVPGQFLPEFTFANMTRVVGAIYTAPTLLEGASVLCDVFKNVLLQQSDMAWLDVEGICQVIKTVNPAEIEQLCLNLTVPGYYGWDYPIALRPINGDHVGLSILLQLLGTTELSTSFEVCPAIDMLFKSDLNLPGITNLIAHAWLSELLPTAAGMCSSWDQVVWYFSPTKHSQQFDTFIGQFTNWTMDTDEATVMAQAMYEQAISTATNLVATLLGFSDQESMCLYIQLALDPTTGQARDEVITEIVDKLYSVMYDANACSNTLSSLMELFSGELGMISNDIFYEFTGYRTPEELCEMVTTYLSEEECPFEFDCHGVCNGTAKYDCNLVCGGDAQLDCSGECMGDAFISECSQMCVGGKTGITDSAIDECGLCTLTPEYQNPLDCNGVCYGTAEVDPCKECSGGETGKTFNPERIDCNGDCDGTAYTDCLGECITAGSIGLTIDLCGDCGGSNACLGCDGVPNSGATYDACGVCSGTSLACVSGINLIAMEADTESELQVFGIFNAELNHQCSFQGTDGTTVEFAMTVSSAETGICLVSLSADTYSFSLLVENGIAGTASSDGQSLVLEVWSSCTEAVDCQGVCGGPAEIDCFNVCGGSAVEDCSGECGGTLEYDCAGACGGDALLDCAGDCNGAAFADCLGECNGAAVRDCGGTCQGEAFTNECGYCVGGTTGRSESLGYDDCQLCTSSPDYRDVRDCNGTCNGDAYFDACGVCVGGTTGIVSDAEERLDCRDVCDGDWIEDSCGYCGPAGSNPVSIYEDCNGDCNPPGTFNVAYDNICNYCVGGQTGLRADYGLDACGICDGGNTTCTGCDGIVLSGAVEDACGECNGDGTTCQIVASISRELVQVGVQIEVGVFGAGFTTLESYLCSFDGPETVTSEMTILSIIEGTCTIGFSVAGTYSVSILVNDVALDVQDNAELIIYAYDGVSLSSIEPSYGLVSDEINTFTLTANTGAFEEMRALGLTPYINVYFPGYFSVFARIQASFRDDATNSISFSYTPSRSAQVILVPALPGIGEVAAEGLTVTIYAPSPQLTDLYFDARGSSIIAVFDSPAIATASTSCSDVLADVSLLGDMPYCQWISPTKLEIRVGSGSDLVSVGNTLTFRRANIVALNEDYPFPEDADSTFQMEVAAPAVVPPVKAVLFGSSTISSCGIIKVFLQSQGAAGRELTNDWSVTSEGDTSQVGDALQSLTGKDLELNGSLIDVDTDYTFSVTITNFLGGSTLASITLRRSAEPTPDVVVNALGIDINNALVSKSFVLQADVFFSECVPPGATAYLWSVDNAAVVLSLKKNSRRLYVAANSLPGGTSVTFTVRAYKETVPDSYAEESITITTLYSDLEAVIAQGQFITVGRDSGDLELDGSLSYDPDNEAVDATYEWLCEQITDNTACWSYKSGHTGETVLTNANPTDSVLTFDAAHLGASKIYFFTLTVRKGLRTATSSIFVSPVAGAPPKVSIAPLTGAVSSDEVLSIRATILHTTALSEVTWSTTDTDSEYSYVDVTDPTNFVTRPTTLQVSDQETFSFMTFDKNILVPGSTYRFNLEVATEDNKTSNATVEVRIRSIVTSCMAGLVDGATSYTELQTITIGVDSCTTDTDAYPLTYQLLMASSEEIYTAITSSESSDRISVTGAPATFISSSNAFNNFRVKVCNSYDSCSEFDFTLTVVAAEFTEAEVASAVENLVDLEEQKQNYQKALTNFNILVLRLGGEQVTNSIGTNVRRRRAVDTTSDANTKTLDLGRKWMDNSDMGTREAEVLINEMSNFKTRESSQADMETLVDQFQETVDIFTENGESIPESSSELLLQKLEEIKREVPSSASRIRGKISTLSDDSIKTLYHSLSLGGGERKTETSASKIVLKRDIPNGRMTFDSNFLVDVGADVKSRFGSNWNCSSGSCDGVTFRFQSFNDSIDDYSQTVEDIANRAASIIEFSLVDPDSGDQLTVSDLSEPVTFNLTITRPQEGKSYECRFWDTDISEWSSSGLTSLLLEADTVTCETTHLSTFTLVVTDSSTTTPSPLEPSSQAEDSEGNEGTEESHTTEEYPEPAYRGNGAIVGIIVGSVVVVVIVAAIVGLAVFIKMKSSSSNKVDSDNNFEAGRAMPAPSAPPADVIRTPSPRPADPPVAFETAEPVAVPLQGEANMPPPPSVYVPPGAEATVVTEAEGNPPRHPFKPDRAPDSESLNSAGPTVDGGNDAQATGASEDPQPPPNLGSNASLPEPST
ncbi:uncharacterized protein [Apostichopus japonicus]|uniref:uncharacterized protein isoform X2 n=1 Tax=Stichopus japonicus TaxID=307972 RepID=UPI003AB1231C